MDDIMKITREEFVKYVGHSLLKPELTKEEVIKGLELAKELKTASVCINPQNVKLATEILARTDVRVGTVIGFPSGAHTTATKVFETKDAYKNGAVEMDMVIDVGALKSKDYQKVYDDIKAVVDASPAVVKVILENAYLTKDEIKKGSVIVEEAGAHYVKTSTGFAQSGSNVEDLNIMRSAVSDKVKVKAAGGLKNLQDCLDAIEAGADRIGISITLEIMNEIDEE
ncbi:deoxyribose-phosphate aldolase [Aerococcus urinaeequi]|uniref:deoxyribose-phosphate aldolase n=1 Tax=Aerococcus urinaeequi TaxID=51665 RepID=UPI003D6B0B94